MKERKTPIENDEKNSIPKQFSQIVVYLNTSENNGRNNHRKLGNECFACFSVCGLCGVELVKRGRKGGRGNDRHACACK